MARNPFLDLLWIEDFLPVLYGSFITRGPFKIFLWTDNLVQVFYSQNRTYRSWTELLLHLFLGPSTDLLWTDGSSKKMENNVGVFCSQKTFFRSPMDRRTCSGLLWTEDLSQVFIDLWDFTSLIGTGFLQTRWKGHQVSYDPRHSKGPKTFNRFRMERRTCSCFLWTDNFLQSSMSQRPSTGLLWPKTLNRSPMNRSHPLTSSMDRRPSMGFLWTKGLKQFLHGPKSSFRTSLDRQVFQGHKSTLVQNFYSPNTFHRIVDISYL